MLPDSVFSSATPSFQFPVPVPGISPLDEPLVCVVFNKYWVPYIVGSLMQLLLQSTWANVTPSQLNTVQEQAFTLIDLFSRSIVSGTITRFSAGGFELLIRQNVDNPCILESSPDGIHWCEFVDMSLCLGGVGQPNGTQPQPSKGGGQQCYKGSFNAGSKFLVPTTVNTGDSILLQIADGAGNDGNELSWRCSDGEVYFAGACTGQTTTNSADPLPTTPHMAIIAQAGAAVFPISEGTPVIVPAGVSDASLYLYVNNGVIGVPSGSYTVVICVTNNQTSSWAHTIDFALSSGGFSLSAPYSNGLWVSGQGWEPDPASSTPQSFSIALTLPHSGVFETAQVTLLSIAGAPAGALGVTNVGATTNLVQSGSPIPASGTPQSFNNAFSGTSFSNIQIESSTTPGLIAQSVTFTGIGINPFVP